LDEVARIFNRSVTANRQVLLALLKSS